MNTHWLIFWICPMVINGALKSLMLLFFMMWKWITIFSANLLRQMILNGWFLSYWTGLDELVKRVISWKASSSFSSSKRFNIFEISSLWSFESKRSCCGSPLLIFELFYGSSSSINTFLSSPNAGTIRMTKDNHNVVNIFIVCKSFLIYLCLFHIPIIEWSFG